MPRLASFLALHLPRRPVRGRTCDYICDWDGCDLAAFTSEQSSAAIADAYAAGVRNEGLYDRQRQRIRSTSAVVRRIRATGEQSS